MTLASRKARLEMVGWTLCCVTHISRSWYDDWMGGQKLLVHEYWDMGETAYALIVKHSVNKNTLPTDHVFYPYTMWALLLILFQEWTHYFYHLMGAWTLMQCLSSRTIFMTHHIFRPHERIAQQSWIGNCITAVCSAQRMLDSWLHVWLVALSWVTQQTQMKLKAW